MNFDAVLPSARRALTRASAALIVLAATAATAATARTQDINIHSLEVAHPASGKVKIVVAAAGSAGTTVGSYSVQLRESVPASQDVPGLAKLNGSLCVAGHDFGTEPSPLLKDNGSRDEDPRPGVFAITVDTSAWPTGRYALLVIASNRPQGGTYVEDRRPVVIKIGDAPDLPEVSNVVGAEHGVIFEQEGTYACFPSLTDLGDGRIVTEFGTRVRASHVDFRGGTQKRVTTDGGRTWLPFDAPIVPPSWKRADGTLVDANADGWIHVPDDQRAELERQQRYVAPNAGPGQVAYLGGAHVRTSTDGGKNWTTRPITVPEDVSGLMHYHDEISQIRTRRGVRLRAVYGPRKGAPKTADEVYFLRSADDGGTWSCVPMFPRGLADPKLGFNETSIVERSDGAILAMMRSNPEGYLYLSVSNDQGLTWSAPEKTDIWGYPCQLLTLADGRLLCVYGYRRAPMGIRACLSDDGGRTWDVRHEMILRADALGSVSDVGYPRIVQLSDGKLLSVYYIATDGTNRRVHIAWTWFDVPPAGAAAASGK